MIAVTTVYGLKVFAFGNAGVLQLTDKEDGEVYRIELRDGVHDLTSYQPLLTAFDAELDSCIVNNRAVGDRHLVDQRGADYGNSAAVPTYSPSATVQFERAVREVSERLLRDQEARIEKRVIAAAAVRFAPPVAADDPAALVSDVQRVDPVIKTAADVSEAVPLTPEQIATVEKAAKDVETTDETK